MKDKKLILSWILSIICIVASMFLINSIYKFSRIEDVIRYLVMGVLVLIDLVILLLIYLKSRKKDNKKEIKKDNKKDKKKKNKYLLFNIVVVLLTIVYITGVILLNKVYSYVSSFNKTVTYSTSLVTLKETEDVDFVTLENAKIGILSDTTSQEGYVLAQEIIKKEGLAKNNELVSFDTYPAMITALYEKEVDYIFLPSDYVGIFSTSEGFEDIGERLRTITTTEKEESKEEANLLGSAADVSKPFTILLIGIDSTKDGLKQADSFNGDSLMVVTFNPTTMTATMLSIPRDTYVPIACFPGQYENKITHSASRGTNCVINTIQNFLDIKIDYYMKINFTGLVDLVDAVDGIEVDVPYSFCEQNSQREFGNSTIYVKKGLQTLNGEQALAFSRNRKSNSQYCSKEWTQGTRSDFVRANNQQTVVQAIIDKMKGFTDVSKLEKILDVVSNNLDTNMTEDTIFSFYNIAKDVMTASSNDEVLSIQKLYIAGTGQYIYDESSKLQLWNYIPTTRSVEDVKNAMKVNLGKKEHTLIKTFSYSINEGYEVKTIGKGPYPSFTTYDLLIDLTKKSLTEAQTWANKNNITLNIEYVTDSKYQNDTIIEQEYPVNKRLDKISNRTVTIKVVKNDIKPEVVKIDCLLDSENSVCIVPNFVSKTKDDVTNWGSKFSNVVNIYYEYKESDLESGTIINQSVSEGTTVKEILEKNITITISIAKEKTEEDNSENNNIGSSEDDNTHDNGDTDEDSTGDKPENEGITDTPTTPPDNTDNSSSSSDNNTTTSDNSDNSTTPEGSDDTIASDNSQNNE